MIEIISSTGRINLLGDLQKPFTGLVLLLGLQSNQFYVANLCGGCAVRKRSGDCRGKRLVRCDACPVLEG